MDAFGWRENGAVNLAVGLLYALLVLAAVAIPNYMRHLDDSRVSTTRELIKNVETATQTYRMKYGKYPELLDTLTQETEDEEALLQGDYMDPWGTEHMYERHGKKRPRITSAGPDGEFDTSDDITNYDGKP